MKTLGQQQAHNEMVKVAYQSGYEAGYLDRAVGIRLDYSWLGREVEPIGSYAYEYSLGYRAGWQKKQY